LSGLTDDIDESISLLRDGIRADPSNENTPYFLAMALQSRGADGDYSEAADLYRRTYFARGGFSYAAANALQLYALSGQADQAAAFETEVATYSGMDVFADEVSSPQFSQNLGQAMAVLETACRRYVIVIFGPETCATGIDTLVAATRSTNYLPERRAIVDVATEGMRMLTIAGGGYVRRTDRKRG
jgi:hypothetical protein